MRVGKHIKSNIPASRPAAASATRSPEGPFLVFCSWFHAQASSGVFCKQQTLNYMFASSTAHGPPRKRSLQLIAFCLVGLLLVRLLCLAHVNCILIYFQESYDSSFSSYSYISIVSVFRGWYIYPQFDVLLIAPPPFRWRSPHQRLVHQ